GVHRLENRWNVLCRPADRERTAIDQNQHRWRAGPLNGFEEVFLNAGEIEAGDIVAFSVSGCRPMLCFITFSPRLLAKDYDGYIGVFCRLHSFLKATFVVVVDGAS